MLFITLMERIVERCDDPRSRNHMKVVKMTKRTIDSYSAYNSTVIPRIGEVIYLNKKGPYDVIAVIHGKRCCDELCHDEVFVEVKPHVCEHTCRSGGYSFKEAWPLILDLESEAETEDK